MHELAAVQNILEIALRHARDQRARRITDIHIVIGQWASMIDDSIQFCWDIISQDTIAQGAKLHFCRIAPEIHCLDCNQTYAPNGRDLFCPVCHGQHAKLIRGDEFYLDAIDIDTSPTDKENL